MKKKSKNIKKIKILIVIFLTFFVGFIGTILVMNKQVFDMTTIMMNEKIQSIEYIRYFSFNVIAFIGQIDNGNFIIDVVKSEWYNLLPFINGIIMVMVVLLLTVITKKIFIRKFNK